MRIIPNFLLLDDEWLFAHEAGHGLGGDHLKQEYIENCETETGRAQEYYCKFHLDFLVHVSRYDGT